MFCSLLNQYCNVTADELRVFIEEHKRHFDPSQLNDFVDMFLYEREYGKENLDRILTVNFSQSISL